MNDLNNKPRIIIFTQGVSRIVPILVKKCNVIGIVESSPRRKKKESLSRKLHLRLKPMIGNLKNYSRKNNIPYYWLDKKSNSNLKQWIIKKDPDLIIVYAMSQLLKPEIFNIPKSTLNLHPSLLPKYKGPNPWFWRYFNMEKEGGVTLHYIDEGEDTGDIVYQAKFDIPLGIKSPELFDLVIKNIGSKLILKAVKEFDNLPRIKQPKITGLKRARNIKVQEHKTIIDWEKWSVDRIWHILRGTELWLDALEQPKGIYKGQRWIVKDYKKTKPKKKDEISKIYKKSTGKFYLVCKDGVVDLELNFKLKTLILSFIKRI